MKKLETILGLAFMIPFSTYAIDKWIYPELITNNEVENFVSELSRLSCLVYIGYQLGQTYGHDKNKK